MRRFVLLLLALAGCGENLKSGQPACIINCHTSTTAITENPALETLTVSEGASTKTTTATDNAP